MLRAKARRTARERCWNVPSHPVREHSGEDFDLRKITTLMSQAETSPPDLVLMYINYRRTASDAGRLATELLLTGIKPSAGVEWPDCQQAAWPFDDDLLRSAHYDALYHHNRQPGTESGSQNPPPPHVARIRAHPLGARRRQASASEHPPGKPATATLTGWLESNRD